MLSYPGQLLEAEVAVDRCYAPSCWYKLSSLALAKHPEAERSLNTGHQDAVSVELEDGVVSGEITVIECFLDSVVNGGVTGLEGGEGCDGTEGLGILAQVQYFSGWSSKDEFCVNRFCHHGHVLQGLDQSASLVSVCDVGLAVASKETIPEIYDLIEALAHPPFGSIKDLSVARNRGYHGSDVNVWISESAYEDSRGTGPCDRLQVEFGMVCC